LTDLEQWTNVLHLSSKWGFDDVRLAAIAAILPLASPVDKLVLARTYALHEWAPPAIDALVARGLDLNVEEARRMTTEDVVDVAKRRREAAVPKPPKLSLDRRTRTPRYRRAKRISLQPALWTAIPLVWSRDG
jgi:hypothetical protein